MRVGAISLAGLCASLLLVTGCAAQTTGAGALTAQDVANHVVLTNQNTWQSIVSDSSSARRPDVDFVRFIMGRDATTIWSECRTELGVLSAPAGWRDGAAVDSALAQYACSVQYPVHPVYLGRLPEHQLEYLYDYWAERLVPCLQSLGLSASLTETRSEFLSAPEFLWSPYDQVELSRMAWTEIDDACPPLDPLVYGPWR